MTSPSAPPAEPTVPIRVEERDGRWWLAIGPFSVREAAFRVREMLRGWMAYGLAARWAREAGGCRPLDPEALESLERWRADREKEGLSGHVYLRVDFAKDRHPSWRLVAGEMVVASGSKKST